MSTIATEAWVLYKGETSHKPVRAELVRESFSFSELQDDEVLVEPLYGSWEGNMAHAVDRRPVDVCRERGEDKVVLGNAGVVRVLKAGPATHSIKEGDLCLLFGNGVPGKFGHMKKAFAYDAPNTVGILAKRTKVPQHALIPIPEGTRHSLLQWAAFPIRYITAWANWQAAYGCLRVLMPEAILPSPFVVGWGGGTTLAELELARFCNCQAAMISSNPNRLELIRSRGIIPVDRREFINLNFDERLYQSDPEYKKKYVESESHFLGQIKHLTGGEGASIFIDYIGSPVFRATIKATASPGVITTAGWKGGLKLSLIRPIECISWHTYVHTHYATYAQGVEAAQFAEERGWIPNVEEFYRWDDIPLLVQTYAEGKTASYFPLFQVNPL